MTTRLREGLGRLALVAAGLLAAVLLGEAGLRLSGFAPERYRSTARLTSPDQRLRLDCYPTNPRGYFDIDLRTPGARARYLSLAPRRWEAVSRRAPHAVEFRYNSHLFRDAEFPAKVPGRRRVMVLGDSFTEGQGVKEPDTFVRVLERLLNGDAPARWEVRNCGRRAIDFPALLQVFEEVLIHQPDLLVFAMVLNDADRSAAFQDRQTYVNDWILDRGHMLIGQPEAPPGPFSSRLAALFRDALDSYRIGRETARWYREMYGEPNREGWLRTVGHLKRMSERTRAGGGLFLVTLWPLMVGLEDPYPFQEPSEEIARACADAGIPFHDLLPALRGRPARSLWVHPVDRHPNETAHRLAAESLAPLVRRLAAAPTP